MGAKAFDSFQKQDRVDAAIKNLAYFRQDKEDFLS